MVKLTVGAQIPDFHFDTPFEKDLDYAQVTSQTNRTALVFLRYYGCTLCQLDIHDFAESYSKIKDAGAQLLIVLQSEAEGIAEQLKTPDALPFRIICDPTKSLYEEFEIAPAKSKLGMTGLHTMAKIERAKKGGYVHGKYEGDELQLPAAFITDEKGTVIYAHYAKSVDDVPDTDELIKQF